MLTDAEALWAAAAVAVALAALHLAAAHVRRLPHLPQRALGSFAGGAAVSYVSLLLLPELALGEEEIGEAVGDVLVVTPLLELTVFLVALAGFVVLYGLERLAVRSGSGRRPPEDSGPGDPPVGVYYVHLGSFALYNGLITYTMPLRFQTGVASRCCSPSRWGCTSC